MRRLALVIPTLDRIGGAERQVMLLAKGFALRGWHVAVIALSGADASAPAELSSSGVDFLSLEMRRGLADPRGWIRLHRWLALHQPDILHAHLPHAAWMARWSRLFASVPVVLDTVHTSSTGTWGRRFGYRFSDALPNAVTAVSASVAAAWQLAHMVSPHHLRMIPNGVDTNHWRPADRASAREQLALPDEFLWLAAGRLEPVKDYPTLLRAFRPVASTARLAIAGAGPCEAALRQLACDLGIAARVRFFGFEPDLRPWLQAADAFALSSLWEGLPMSVLEASACALPCVATDVPGSREAILHEQTGLLVAPQNHHALAAAMTRIMNMSADSRNAMGVRARHRVVQSFSLDCILDRWEALYGELLDHAPAPVERARFHHA